MERLVVLCVLIKCVHPVSVKWCGSTAGSGWEQVTGVPLWRGRLPGLMSVATHTERRALTGW